MAKNIAICLIGRILKYEINLDSIIRFTNKLKSQNYNVYYFVSLNAIQDDYHIEFERVMNELNNGNCFFKYEEFKLPSQLQHCETMYKMCSMFYNQYRCMQMVLGSNINFDIYLKWRTEIRCNIDIEIVNELDNNTIYVPIGRDYGGLNDQIAYGNIDSMKKYSDVYNRLEYLTKVYHVNIHPETLLMNHIKYQQDKLLIIRFDFDYDLHR